jgi:hypothetical protein
MDRNGTGGRHKNHRSGLPNATEPEVFVGHCARLLPEKTGLQAVGAIIWCAVLADFRQNPEGC